ncbi:hypothetical protein Tco_1329409 [Tanacetum coccineum]
MCYNTTITNTTITKQPSPTQTGTEHHLPTPHDSPLHAVHSYGSDEGSLKLNELTDLVTKLSDRIGGRKLSDAEVQDKASNDTEPVIQDVTPTEVIQDQESSEKGSAEVSTAGAKQGYCSEEVPIWMKKKVKSMAEAKSTKKIDWNDPSVIRISDFKEMRSSEKMKSSEKIKSPEKIVEEDIDAQEEMKEVVKEPGAKRKKSIPRKSIRKGQKMEEVAEKEELKGFLDIIPREEVPIELEIIDFCVVHYILLMENGLAIHMLTEKKYPLSQELLSKMLSRKLEVDHESSQAFELLRFIRSQVQK